MFRPPSLLLRLSLIVVLCFGTSACSTAAWGRALTSIGNDMRENREPSTSNSGNRIVTESRIDGEFECWTFDTPFVLLNGQVWRQMEPVEQRCLLLSPRVTIIRESNGRHLMFVEGVDTAVRVMWIG